MTRQERGNLLMEVAYRDDQIGLTTITKKTDNINITVQQLNDFQLVNTAI